jgi:hypothetical protein
MNALLNQLPDPQIAISIILSQSGNQPVFRELPLTGTRPASMTERELEQAYEEPERWDGMS